MTSQHDIEHIDISESAQQIASRQTPTRLAFIIDEFGSKEGVAVLSDVGKTIAGNMPNEGEKIDPRYDIQQNSNGSRIANAHLPVKDLPIFVTFY